MATLTVAHTAPLVPSTLDDAWRMVRAAFPPGEFGDEDWSHALGGMHAIVEEGGRVVAHGSVVLRRFIHDGRTLRVGYVEAVAVAADVRRGATHPRSWTRSSRSSAGATRLLVTHTR